MDESEDLIRWMSHHRMNTRHLRVPRPVVSLSCWNCGHELSAPRPEGTLPCSCGGVYTELLSLAADFGEE